MNNILLSMPVSVYRQLLLWQQVELERVAIEYPMGWMDSDGIEWVAIYIDV